MTEFNLPSAVVFILKHNSWKIYNVFIFILTIVIQLLYNKFGTLYVSEGYI